MTSPISGSIPHYYLYGDLGADVELDLLHIEPIRDRSGPNDWRIRPHTHPDHMQFLFVKEGGGQIRFEEKTLPIPAPALLVVPAGIVHQIDFDHGSDGFVITAALGCLRAATSAEPLMAEVASHGAVYPIAQSGIEVADVSGCFEALQREFIWPAPGRRSAILAHYMRVLVMAWRLSHQSAQAQTGSRDRNHDLVLRYRGLLEQNFRTERGLTFYANALAVTPARLNAACKLRAGKTASDLLYDRLIVEAKRYLLYTESSVAQVAHLAGFEDPAYFNRFFTQRVGQSPGAFRKASNLTQS